MNGNDSENATTDCLDLGGTVRAVPAEQTLLRVRPLLSRIGITRVARITGLDHIGIPVSVAIRPTGRLLATSQGKGITPLLADLSAIMESIETWHAEQLPESSVRGARRDLLSEHAVIDLAALPPGPPGCSRPTDATVLDWLFCKELPSGRDVLLPRGCFDLDTTQPVHEGAGLHFAPVTTGLASGNTYVEALLHALYETIERDAHARLDDLPVADRLARRLDLSTLAAEDTTNRWLIEKLQGAGLSLEVTDMTTDLGLPAVHAAIVELDSGSRLFVDEGMGAHLKPEIALSRALTEAVQSRLAYISGSRDDIFPHVYREDRLRTQLGGMSQSWAGRAASKSGGVRAFSDVARPPFALSLQQNLSTVLQLLGRRDARPSSSAAHAYVFDHTRSDLGIPVVHVLCPGLRDPFRVPPGATVSEGHA